METKLGTNPDPVLKVLGQHDITRTLAKQAIEIAKEKAAFTVFAVLDALTRLSAKITHAANGPRATNGRAACSPKARRTCCSCVTKMLHASSLARVTGRG